MSKKIDAGWATMTFFWLATEGATVISLGTAVVIVNKLVSYSSKLKS
jgi:hypothetical protein